MNNIRKRRSYYAINRDIGPDKEEVVRIIEELTELTPDAYNMKSARVVLVLGDKQNQLWDTVYDAFNGKVARDKIDGFKAGYGTVLYYIDEDTVKSLQEKFPSYADNFTKWSEHANAMLQFNIWTALRGENIGASLQHYNPVIDEPVAKLLDLPQSWRLIAQMPFGGIVEEREPKEKEDIRRRVFIKE